MLAPTAISSIADRQVIPPWGLDGGEPGRPNRFAVVSESGATTSLQQRFGLQTNSKFTNLPLDAGDALLVESGGGGGYGPPNERDPALVSRDVEFGYASSDEWPEFRRV
jgi:N-methylhydantoinase B